MAELFHKTKYARHLPTQLNSHQVLDLGRFILRVGQKAIDQSARDSNQQSPIPADAYQQSLRALGRAIDQLHESHTRRKFKSPQDMRGVGGLDGKGGDDSKSGQAEKKATLSHVKRAAYQQRRKLMSLFRMKVDWDWKVLQVSENDDPLLMDSTTMLKEAVDRRINGFEKLSYSESNTEFNHFFFEIEEGPQSIELSAALNLLGLDGIFAQLKTSHGKLAVLRDEMNQLAAEKQKITRVVPATKDVRHAAKMVLALMHFDIENGDDRFRRALATLDKLIKGQGAIGKMRETRKENRKGKEKEQEKQQEKEQEMTREKVKAGEKQEAEANLDDGQKICMKGDVEQTNDKGRALTGAQAKTLAKNSNSLGQADARELYCRHDE